MNGVTHIKPPTQGLTSIYGVKNHIIYLNPTQWLQYALSRKCIERVIKGIANIE